MEDKIKLKTSLGTIFDCDKYLNDLQEEAAENILKRNRDIFVSGYGKSLCYQLPVMVIDNSFIIVITSRVPYMKKYTNYFTTNQITTNYLTASTSRRRKNLIENDIISKKSRMKILFITPLQYETAYFKTILKKIDKKRLLGIVIDQADNILSKQENLCNQYQNLDLKVIRVPIITITSTSSAKVQKDIIKNFQLLNPRVYAMPILRANLYCDVHFMNILSKPMENLKKSIDICLDMDSDTHSKKEENWGLIVCKDLETITSITEYLRSENISVLPSDTYLSQGKRSKNTNLVNFKDVKVVLLCEKDDTLSVTNSLVQVMTLKSIEFIFYWEVLPNIEKYYLLISRVQCLYKLSFCRVYCKVDRVIDNWMKYSCQNDINNELSTVILGNLTKMQCRHKAYSNFFGDTFAACINCCDICYNREKVVAETTELMTIINNINLDEKLQQILKLSKDSNKTCDGNLQYKCSQQMISKCKTESNVNVKVQKENREDDHSNVVKSDAYNNEAICENHVKIDKKIKALADLSDVYGKTWKKMPCQSISNKRKIDSNAISKGREDSSSNSLYSANKQYKSSKNPPATQSSNLSTVNGIKKVSVEAFKAGQRAIANADKCRQEKCSNSSNRRKIDSNAINKGREDSSSKSLYFDNEQYKSSKNPAVTQSSNVRTVNGIEKTSIEARKAWQRAIAKAEKYRLEKGSNSSNRRKIDTIEIIKGREASTNKSLYSDNEQHKSSKNPPATQSSNGRTVNGIEKASVEACEAGQRAIAKAEKCRQVKCSNSGKRRKIDSNGITKGREASTNKSLCSDNEQHKSSKNPPATQSSNVRTVNGKEKASIEAREEWQRLIAKAEKFLEKCSNSSNSRKIDSNGITKGREASTNKSLYSDNEQHKSSSKKSHVSEKKTIELITISDDDTTDPNEVNIVNKKRHRSTVQTEGSFEQIKRRKLS